jgi:hypothetical protein
MDEDEEEAELKALDDSVELADDVEFMDSVSGSGVLWMSVDVEAWRGTSLGEDEHERDDLLMDPRWAVDDEGVCEDEGEADEASSLTE